MDSESEIGSSYVQNEPRNTNCTNYSPPLPSKINYLYNNDSLYAPTVIDESKRSSQCSTTDILDQLENTYVQTAHSTLTFDQSVESTPNWL